MVSIRTMGTVTEPAAGARGAFRHRGASAVSRFVLGIFVFLLLGFGAAPALRAADGTAEFDAAAKLYEGGRPLDAARAYERLLTNGVVTDSVWFNQGNAWFKAGRIGRAIAAYREAQRLAPRDRDVAANLALARSKVAGGAGRPPGGDLALFSWLAPDEWAWAALVALWIWCGVLMVRVWRPAWRDGTSSLAWLLGGLTLLLAAGAGASWRASGRGSAVVVVAEATLRFGPLAEAQVAFPLTEGVEMRILDRKNDWLQVRDSNGRTAWIPRTEVSELR